MAEMEDSKAWNLEFQEAWEALVDKYTEVFDTIILNDSIQAAQGKLKDLQLQGIDTHGVFSSFFFYFSIEKTPSCPEFIKWWINNYSPSEGVIMDTSRFRMLCPINSLSVQNTLLL